MPLPNNFASWEFTQKVIRIGHNREVKKHFKDIKSDDSVSNPRDCVKTALLIRDQDSALEVLNKQMYFQLNLKYNDQIPVASLPETWPIRVGADRPQLAIIFRPKGKKTSYQIVIPHYDGTRNPIIPSYKKGNYRGELILKDNSQIVVNAATEQEAKRMIRALQRYVSPKTLIVRKPRFLPIRGQDFRVIDVQPIFADFHPHGQVEDKPPLWRKRF